MQFSDAFRAMDTDVDVLIECEGPPPFGAFLSLHLLFEQQEERFSRFRPGSLLSRLNAGETIEQPLFARACGMATEAHRFSGGLYNPMVLPALVEAGYGVTFKSVAGGRPRPQAVPDPAHCLAISGDRVSLVEGALDLGGIIKGWTADLGVELLQHEHPNLFLNAGGDLRCTGCEEGLDGWLVAVDGPSGDIPWQGVMRGAVATSTVCKRRWTAADGSSAHHLIDPRTGLPASSRFDQVSCWHRETWRAEVWAKAVLIGGDDTAGAAQAAGCQVIAITGAGETAAWEAAG